MQSNQQLTFIPYLLCAKHCSPFLTRADLIRTTHVTDEEAEAQSVTNPMP